MFSEVQALQQLFDRELVGAQNRACLFKACDFSPMMTPAGMDRQLSVIQQQPRRCGVSCVQGSAAQDSLDFCSQASRNLIYLYAGRQTISRQGGRLR